jgi:8-oxo-dGTP pyrophosphatase MutT (NUDIX family)
MIPPKKFRPVAAIIVKKGNKFLLVKKPRKKNAWQFPQGGVDAGENHAESALRELAEECGTDIKINMNPTPIGQYEYPFPEDFVRHHGEYFGAKVVFFKADYVSGEVHVDGTELIDYQWLEAETIKDFVAEKYWSATKKFIETKKFKR